MAYFLMAFLLIFSESMAKDLGSFGRTYGIAEEDFKEVIQKRLLDVNFQDSYLSSIEHPRQNVGLEPSEKYSVKYIDPSVTAQNEIRDSEGRVICRKGERFNPLENAALREPLAFFDATDEKQLAWARSAGSCAKWILAKGIPLQLEKEEKRPVYFDQGGVLVQKFEIHSLPAMVSQEGHLLKIEEFFL